MQENNNNNNTWVTGKTGSGKSHYLQNMLCTELNPANYPHVTFLIADPKGINFKETSHQNVTLIQPTPTDILQSVEEFLSGADTSRLVYVFIDDLCVAFQTQDVEAWFDKMLKAYNIRFFVTSNDSVINSQMFTSIML